MYLGVAKMVKIGIRPYQPIDAVGYDFVLDNNDSNAANAGALAVGSFKINSGKCFHIEFCKVIERYYF